MTNLRRSDVANSNSDFAGREQLIDPSLGVFICASCDNTEELVLGDNSEEPSLCRECRSPLLILDSPNEYCELGGGD